MLTKDRLPESATNYAQGGIASVWSPEDSFEAHVEDTLVAGAGLCHRDVVELVVREGPERVRELIALGTHFSCRDEHRGPRVRPRARGRPLATAASCTPPTPPAARSCARWSPPCAPSPTSGCSSTTWPSICSPTRERDPPRQPCPAGAPTSSTATAARSARSRARATLLATGGAGKVYLYTSNPDIATGDGIAMAYRAGVPIANMEFIQFHPTCLYHPAAKSFLVTEALRGEGAILRRPDGSAVHGRATTRAPSWRRATSSPAPSTTR